MTDNGKRKAPVDDDLPIETYYKKRKSTSKTELSKRQQIRAKIENPGATNTAQGKVRLQEDGPMLWLNPDTGEWEPAIYHNDIRSELLDRADMNGHLQYAHPRARGIAADDRTAFHPDQKDWNPDRDHWPLVRGVDVLHKLERLGWKGTYDDVKAPNWYENGLIVIDHDKHPLRKFPDLPDALSSAVDDWCLEIWCRLDKRIQRQDIRGRMPGLVTLKRGRKIPIYGLSAIGQKRSRFRQKYGLIAWEERVNLPRVTAFMKARLDANALATNSTRGTKPLSKSELEKVEGITGTQKRGQGKTQRYDVEDDETEEVLDEDGQTNHGLPTAASQYGSFPYPAPTPARHAACTNTYPYQHPDNNGVGAPSSYSFANPYAAAHIYARGIHGQFGTYPPPSQSPSKSPTTVQSSPTVYDPMMPQYPPPESEMADPQNPYNAFADSAASQAALHREALAGAYAKRHRLSFTPGLTAHICPPVSIQPVSESPSEGLPQQEPELADFLDMNVVEHDGGGISKAPESHAVASSDRQTSRLAPYPSHMPEQDLEGFTTPHSRSPVLATNNQTQRLKMPITNSPAPQQRVPAMKSPASQCPVAAANTRAAHHPLPTANTSAPRHLAPAVSAPSVRPILTDVTNTRTLPFSPKTTRRRSRPRVSVPAIRPIAPRTSTPAFDYRHIQPNTQDQYNQVCRALESARQDCASYLRDAGVRGVKFPAVRADQSYQAQYDILSAGFDRAWRQTRAGLRPVPRLRAVREWTGGWGEWVLEDLV